VRNLVRETKLTVHDFVLPLFVSEKLEARQAIKSMPGVFQFAVSEVAGEAQQAYALGGLSACELDIASMPSLSNAGARYVHKSMMSIGIRHTLAVPEDENATPDHHHR